MDHVEMNTLSGQAGDYSVQVMIEHVGPGLRLVPSRLPISAVEASGINNDENCDCQSNRKQYSHALPRR